ncbi:MAG: hypothetical protein K1X29_09525 [Bdellovibrionales bacterium]|nr:hypothetical protein [Bdellovibrionales bacterium]
MKKFWLRVLHCWISISIGCFSFHVNSNASSVQQNVEKGLVACHLFLKNASTALKAEWKNAIASKGATLFLQGESSDHIVLNLPGQTPFLGTFTHAGLYEGWRPYLHPIHSLGRWIAKRIGFKDYIFTPWRLVYNLTIHIPTTTIGKWIWGVSNQEPRFITVLMLSAFLGYFGPVNTLDRWLDGVIAAQEQVRVANLSDRSRLFIHWIDKGNQGLNTAVKNEILKQMVIEWNELWTSQLSEPPEKVIDTWVKNLESCTTNLESCNYLSLSLRELFSNGKSVTDLSGFKTQIPLTAQEKKDLVSLLISTFFDFKIAEDLVFRLPEVTQFLSQQTSNSGKMTWIAERYLELKSKPFIIKMLSLIQNHQINPSVGLYRLQMYLWLSYLHQVNISLEPTEEVIKQAQQRELFFEELALKPEDPQK